MAWAQLKWAAAVLQSKEYLLYATKLAKCSLYLCLLCVIRDILHLAVRDTSRVYWQHIPGWYYHSCQCLLYRLLQATRAKHLHQGDTSSLVRKRNWEYERVRFWCMLCIVVVNPYCFVWAIIVASPSACRTPLPMRLDHQITTNRRYTKSLFLGSSRSALSTL